MKTTTLTRTTPMRLTMRSAVLAAALVMSGAAGCDKKSEPAKTNVPKPPAPDVTPKSTSDGMSAAPSSDSGAGAGVKSSPTTATSAQPSPSTTKPADPAVDAPLVTSTESAKHSKEAQDLLSKAMQSLKDSKFEDCKTALDKVDAMGNNVPKATREQSTTIRKSLDAAQKLQKSPELPAGEGPNK
jgi:hypothetical protein